ncbi:MAG: exo-rhamnogalacturonan lyase family protein [Planctomycetota bacterium]
MRCTLDKAQRRRWRRTPTFLVLLCCVVVFPTHAQEITQLRLDEPLDIARQSVPVTGGVPLAQGMVSDVDCLRVLTVVGDSVPAQFRVLARWPDRSVKWVLVDLQSDLAARGRAVFRLSCLPEMAPTRKKIRMFEDADKIQVDTGPLRFAVRRDRFNFLDAVWIDTNGDGQANERVVDGTEQGGCRCIDMPKNVYWSGKAEDGSCVTVEEQGPLRVVIHAKGEHGDHSGKPFCGWEVRIHAFAGKPYVRVFHTFTFVGDPEFDFVRDVSLHLPLSFARGADGKKSKRVWSAMLDDDLFWHEIERDRWVAVVQDRYDHAKLYNEAFKKLPLGKINVARISPRGDRLAHIREYTYHACQVGHMAPGIIDYSNHSHGVSLLVRHFRELYPNEIQIDADRDTLIAHLWPEHHDFMNLSRGKQVSSYSGQEGFGTAEGMARTQEIYFHFHSGPDMDLPLLRSLAEPIRIGLNPKYLTKTGALGKIHPHDPQRFPEIEAAIEGLFDWQIRHVERNQWYGKWDFGGTQISWSPRTESWTDCARHAWTINEVSNTYGPWIMYARTGKPKYFRWGEISARYLIEVGTVHGKGKNAGAQRRHAEKHWGGGTDSTHTYLHAPLAYYYFTGDMRAYDVLQQSGKYIIETNAQAHDLARDSGKFALPSKRGFVNLLNASALLFELIGDERYQKIAQDRIAAWMAEGRSNHYGAFALNEWMMRHDFDAKLSEFYVNICRALMKQKPSELPDIVPVAGDTSLMKPSSIWPHDPSPANLGRFFHGHIFRAMADAYWLTGEEIYLQVALEDLYDFLDKVDQSEDWRYRGNLRGWNTSMNTNMCATVPYLLAALADLSPETWHALRKPYRGQPNE